jgi:hypothetical protein
MQQGQRHVAEAAAATKQGWQGPPTFTSPHPAPAPPLTPTPQVCELCIYLVLLADWAALGAWDNLQPVLLALAVAAAPVMYSRRIVDFGKQAC